MKNVSITKTYDEPMKTENDDGSRTDLKNISLKSNLNTHDINDIQILEDQIDKLTVENRSLQR